MQDPVLSGAEGRRGGDGGPHGTLQGWNRGLLKGGGGCKAEAPAQWLLSPTTTAPGILQGCC